MSPEKVQSIFSQQPAQPAVSQQSVSGQFEPVLCTSAHLTTYVLTGTSYLQIRTFMHQESSSSDVTAAWQQ